MRLGTEPSRTRAPATRWQRKAVTRALTPEGQGNRKGQRKTKVPHLVSKVVNQEHAASPQVDAACSVPRRQVHWNEPRKPVCTHTRCSNSPSWPSRSRCLVSVVTHTRVNSHSTSSCVPHIGSFCCKRVTRGAPRWRRTLAPGHLRCSCNTLIQGSDGARMEGRAAGYKDRAAGQLRWRCYTQSRLRCRTVGNKDRLLPVDAALPERDTQRRLERRDT